MIRLARPHAAALVLALGPLALALLLAAPALAQTTPPAAAPQASPEAAPADPDAPKPKADCAKIPGGNAPINRLAALEGGLAVQNLEFTYYGKPLFQLTDADYKALIKLLPECNPKIDADTAKLMIENLQRLVRDANRTRDRSIAWIRGVETEIAGLPRTQESLVRLHALWQEMLNRELEMTRADLRYVAELIRKRTDALYKETPARVDGPVSPFDPGPTQK